MTVGTLLPEQLRDGARHVAKAVERGGDLIERAAEERGRIREVGQVRQRIERVERVGNSVHEPGRLVEQARVDAAERIRRRWWWRALAQCQVIEHFVGPVTPLLEAHRIDHDELNVGGFRDVGDEGDRLTSPELLAHRRQEFAALLVGEEASGDFYDRGLGVQILKQTSLAARYGQLGELPRFG